MEAGNLKVEQIIYDSGIIADMKAGKKRVVISEIGHRVYDIEDNRKG